MKKIVIFLIVFISIKSTAQSAIEKLTYAKKEITVPENCVAESITKISDCNGFFAMWYEIDSAGRSMRKQTIKQIEEQIKYKTKTEIKFNSQNQLFEGVTYKMEDETYRIIGFGIIDEIPIMIILGFQTEVKTNEDLKEFEKNFITFI